MLSALVEEPQLFASPLPPLRELLLGAAAYRVQLAPHRYEPYDGPYVPETDDVIRLDAWRP